MEKTHVWFRRAPYLAILADLPRLTYNYGFVINKYNHIWISWGLKTNKGNWGAPKLGDIPLNPPTYRLWLDHIPILSPNIKYSSITCVITIVHWC